METLKTEKAKEKISPQPVHSVMFDDHLYCTRCPPYNGRRARDRVRLTPRQRRSRVRLYVDEYKKIYSCPVCHNETHADTDMDPVDQTHTEGNIRNSSAAGGGYDRAKYLDSWMSKIPNVFFTEHNVDRRILFEKVHMCVKAFLAHPHIRGKGKSVNYSYLIRENLRWHWHVAPHFLPFNPITNNARRKINEGMFLRMKEFLSDTYPRPLEYIKLRRRPEDGKKFVRILKLRSKRFATRCIIFKLKRWLSVFVGRHNIK